MRTFAGKFTIIALCFGLSASVSFAQGNSTIRRIAVLPGSAVELEIAGSGPLKPQAHVIQNPDRLVLDFPGTIPAQNLHSVDINRGEVKDARVGLFSSKPAVTRIVLDLKSAQSYQLFPSGNTVVVKFAAQDASVTPVAIAGKAETTDADLPPETVVSIEHAGGAITTSSKHAQGTSRAMVVPAQTMPVRVANPRMEVLFENGLLSIRSTKASLSEVLSEIHRQTGAEIAIPAGAETESVFTNLGPGAPKEVLSALLNGSHFNFIVIGSERDPGGVRQVVLTPKEGTGGAPEAVVYPCGTSATQPAMAQVQPTSEPAPVQAFGTPMPPEQQADPGATDAQAQAPPPQ